MGRISDIYKSINAIKQIIVEKINLNYEYTNMLDKDNNIKISNTQNALIEVDEDRLQVEADAENALIELDEAIDERLADIENALCELTEEE